METVGSLSDDFRAHANTLAGQAHYWERRGRRAVRRERWLIAAGTALGTVAGALLPRGWGEAFIVFVVGLF